ncbi:DNA-deoxyinosine glycosylase [Undibacterium rugosum]|uniref:DNA-deoxyinosine glycosylase n=1 Tax=Undibacterium rugosum TaxID=2762291 RepID=UPI001B83115A|nr:DNA-deoxyinosine glycosylase [Undibacterium rugosum]MBR7779257.1 DNA-deoxyinosine glycosylase [Undibacterium rugosum]
MTPTQTELQGFPPLIDAQTHTLILGSFPGVASLQAGQYYAHPQNQFWRLLSAMLNADLYLLTYHEKTVSLLNHGIGLWDIYASCYREGSLDSAIRLGQFNDFSALRHSFPKLQRIGFNGKVAAKIQSHFQQQGFQTLILPSSSPANASWSFEKKLSVWQQLLRFDAQFS